MTESETETWRAICEIGRRLWQRNLIAANDGNISMRLDGERILCTPSGVSKGFLGADDWVITDAAGRKLKGQREPSSELKMHLAIYGVRPDVGAVVHAHPPHATAFAVAGQTVPARVMPEIDVLLGRVGLVPYIAPGTQELADAVGAEAKAENDASNAILLGNHGATTCGVDLEAAWLRMESLDQCCQILINARALGEWREM